MSDRTKLSKDVETMDPSFLEEFIENDQSLEGLEDYFIPPVLKKLEANSRSEELVKQFGAGSIILSPQNDCVWQMGDDPFKFVPIIFVPIYRKWLDFEDPEGPMVVDTSFDRASSLAKISRNSNKRNVEEYGNQGYKYQCIEHLTFGGIIYEGKFAGIECFLSFERSGHFTGQSFLTAIQSRRVTINEKSRKQPLWSQVWGIELIPKSNKKGRWHGINFKVVTPSVIAQKHVEPFKELHEKWKELQEKERIVFDDESTDNNVDTTVDTTVDTSGDDESGF